MSQGIYVETGSSLHRLNPLTKFVLIIPTTLILTLVVDIAVPALFSLFFLLALLTLGRVPASRLGRALLPFLPVGLGLLWTTAAFYQTRMAEAPAVALNLGPFQITWAGLSYAVSIVLRVLAIYASSLLFLLTTHPTDFILALVQQCRLPVRLGYGVMAAYRFVPLLSAELAQIRAAHRVRGVPEGGGPFGSFRRLLGYAIPLLASGIRRAQKVAVAMDARALGAQPRRTFYRRLRFSRTDLAFLLAYAIFTVIVLSLLVWMGLPARLDPFGGPTMRR